MQLAIVLPSKRLQASQRTALTEWTGMHTSRATPITRSSYIDLHVGIPLGVCKSLGTFAARPKPEVPFAVAAATTASCASRPLQLCRAEEYTQADEQGCRHGTIRSERGC
jgi:hypothetical protein